MKGGWAYVSVSQAEKNSQSYSLFETEFHEMLPSKPSLLTGQLSTK